MARRACAADVTKIVYWTKTPEGRRVVDVEPMIYRRLYGDGQLLVLDGHDYVVLHSLVLNGVQFVQMDDVLLCPRCFGSKHPLAGEMEKCLCGDLQYEQICRDLGVA